MVAGGWWCCCCGGWVVVSRFTFRYITCSSCEFVGCWLVVFVLDSSVLFLIFHGVTDLVVFGCFGL